MCKKTLPLLTLLLCLFLNSNFIYAQDNFIEVISNKSIKFSKEGQEKLNRVKNQKLYQEPQIVQFRDIEKVIKEKNLEFVLPNYSCKLSFEYQSGEYEDSNNYHWYGTMFNEKQKNCYDGSILFVKKDGEIFGTINIDESAYEFIEIEKGYQVLYKINPTEKAICGNENEKETNPTKNKTKKEEPIDQNTMQRIECLELSRVRILVLYTPAAAASVTDITATTNLAAQQMRTALTNSLVSKNDLQIELAAILPLSFVETPNGDESDVNLLSNNTSAQSLRNTYKADLVVLMTNASYGNVFGRVKAIDQGFSNGYAIVVAANASSTKTFAHETGHLLGGRHEDDPNGTIQHGHHFRKNIFSPLRGTINATLTGQASDCRVLHYSNPNVNYDGTSTGTANSRYIAQHFRTSGKQVAAYFPNTPGNFYTSIIGSSTPCPWQENWYEADVRCGTPPFTIQWHTSTNGVNYTYQAAGEFFLFQAPIQSGTATTIRMTVTGANNVTQTQYIQTTSYSAPNSFSCSGNTGSGFRTESENKVIATVSPNPIEGKSKLYVELPKEDNQTQILIVDSFGKTIQTLDTSKFTQKGEFDITSLSTGLYYISIRSPKNGLHSITIHVK